jgi:cytidine deaminase
MKYRKADRRDEELVRKARAAIRRNYTKDRFSVGAAVRCASGRVYAGVNIDSCGYGPCAEPVALGAAVAAGERSFSAIVAVYGGREDCPVIPPCGNCRQLLADYAPDADVILERGGRLVKARALDLLPSAYRLFRDDSRGAARPATKKRSRKS